MKKFDLPKDWSWKALGECCEIVNGSTPKRSNDEYWGGNIAWITPTEVGEVEGKFLDDSEEKITEEGYENCSTTLLPENSVIYSSRASIGHIAINEVPVCTNQGFKSFVTGDDVDPEYLYYCLQWKTPEIEHIAEGSTYTEISKRDMSKVEIPLPPLDVQRRIVTVLDRADALRKKRRKAILRFDELLQAAFFELFGDPVTNPKGWDTTKFGDLLTTSLWNGLSPSTDGTHPGRVLILSAITDSVFRPEEVKEANFDRPLSEAQERIVDTDTFLICRGNGNLSMVGTGVFPTESMPNTLFPDTIIGARPDQDRIHPAYLETLWSTQYVRGQLEKVARTTNGTHKINQKKTRNIELRLPPMELQKQFASIHSKVRKNKQRYDSDRFDDLFDALLHKAFRGELDLNDAFFEDMEASKSASNHQDQKVRIGEQKALFG